MEYDSLDGALGLHDSISEIALMQLFANVSVQMTDPRTSYQLDFTAKILPILVAYYVVAFIICIIYIRRASKEVYMTVITVLLMIGHVLVHVLCERFTVLTAIYVLTEVVTTIGYGDITPATTSGRVVTSIMVLWMLVAVAYVLNKVMSGVTNTSLEGSAWTNWVKASGYFVVAILIGTLFFATYEDCSCSYGITLQAGCVDGTYAECIASNGFAKTWIEACYFSIITLTTVGFGDFAPVTPLGRALGVIWMLLGTAIAANWLAATTQLMFIQEKAAPGTREIFKLLDKNEDGCLDQLEYCMFELMKQGIVSDDTYTGLCKQFGSLNKSTKDVVTYDEIHHSRDSDKTSKRPLL